MAAEIEVSSNIRLLSRSSALEVLKFYLGEEPIPDFVLGLFEKLFDEGLGISWQVPDATPRWISGDLIGETIIVLSPLQERDLAVVDALAIIQPVSQLADVLEV